MSNPHAEAAKSIATAEVSRLLDQMTSVQYDKFMTALIDKFPFNVLDVARQAMK